MLPTNIPIMEIITVADVNRRIVFGNFSKIISFTSEDPESLVRNVACPKSNNIILHCKVKFD